MMALESERKRSKWDDKEIATKNLRRHITRKGDVQGRPLSTYTQKRIAEDKVELVDYSSPSASPIRAKVPLGLNVTIVMQRYIRY